jgi:hypothetical protein
MMIGEAQSTGTKAYPRQYHEREDDDAPKRYW